jgi:chaperonin cofactor prefoldin
MEEQFKYLNFRKHSNKKTSLKSELSALVQNIRDSQSGKFSFWQEALGEKLAKVAQPYSIRKGILFVKVQDPVWRFELNREKEELLKRIRTQAKQIIKDIVFT